MGCPGRRCPRAKNRPTVQDIQQIWDTTMCLPTRLVPEGIEEAERRQTQVDRKPRGRVRLHLDHGQTQTERPDRTELGDRRFGWCECQEEFATSSPAFPRAASEHPSGAV